MILVVTRVIKIINSIFFKIPSFTNEEKDSFNNDVIKIKDKDIGSSLDSFLNEIQINTSSILI